MTGIESFAFTGAAQTPIVGDARGPADGLPIILIHGGGQTRFAWGQAADRLAHSGFRAVTLDLRGHGESGWAPRDRGYRIDDYADDVRLATERVARPPILVGASLGGLAAAIAAGEAPRAPIAGLCLVDVSPHLKADGVAGILGFMKRTSTGFDTLEEAAAAVSAYLPHRPRSRDLDGLRRNLRVEADGRLHWHWDPGTIDPPLDPATTNPRIEAAAGSIDVPSLLLRGELSELVSRAAADEYMARFPLGSVEDIPGARHMVAGDRNDAFVQALMAFAMSVRARSAAAND